MASSTDTLVGVAAALASSASSSPSRTALSQFLLLGRVALVTGGHRGLGLEMALALAEAGAIVYCLDLPTKPDADWLKVQSYAAQLPDLDGDKGKGKLEYVSGDVTNQAGIWRIAEDIAEKEGSLDICIANAGIGGSEGPCLEQSAESFTKVIDINLNGVLFSAQAAGRQMERLGIRGSIIMTASVAGSVALVNLPAVAYGASKAGVLQMARSMACELGSKGIRVNTISPSYFNTRMVRSVAEVAPHIAAEWPKLNPLGRLGETSELRGVVLWLAGEASTFCTGSNISVDGGYCAW